MKIVIIGANGQLGIDCCNILGVENEVIGCDIPEIDISSTTSVTDYLTPQQPDVIINCAAYTAVDHCETETALAWKVNAEGPANLAKTATELGARLIHISTDYVFDGYLEPPNSYKETDTTNPLSQYGKSKLAGEKAVLTHASDNIILRTAWLYSAYGKNFLKTMLRLAVADPKREMKVVNDQHGSLTWSYTLAQQIQKLLTADIQGIVHTTSDGHSTWYEAARYFLDCVGVEYAMKPCTTDEYPTPAHRPANSILENKVLDQAGISIFNNWKNDIDSFVERYREKLLTEAKEN
jgi:dTDP-4-dehydrorhamnose reductase